MARRRLADAQTSRLAVWARRCAFFSLVATLMAVIIVRTGLLEIVPALATFGGALVFAVFGIVLALGAFITLFGLMAGCVMTMKYQYWRLDDA